MTQSTSILIKQVESYSKTPEIGRSESYHGILNNQLHENKRRVEVAIEVLQSELYEIEAAIKLHNGSVL